MIKADSTNRHTDVEISGDAETILNETMIILSHVLKAFHSHGQENVVLLKLIDTIDDFGLSIINKKFNSKGEEKDD